MDSIETFIESYGELIFDLCDSILRNSQTSQMAFRSILRKIRSERKAADFVTYQRSWVLRIACSELLSFAQRFGPQVTPADRIALDATGNATARLKQFSYYFFRLSPEDQILLLLRDKYGIAYVEVSTAMNIPEESLKIKRQQALRSLEEWLWENP